MQVELRQLVGTVIGGTVTDGTPAQVSHDIDEVRVVDTKGESKRIGFCPHADGAAVRFVRILADEQRAEIRGEVARLRSERGLSTSETTTQPPDPAEIRRAMKKGKS